MPNPPPSPPPTSYNDDDYEDIEDEEQQQQQDSDKSTNQEELIDEDSPQEPINKVSASRPVDKNDSRDDTEPISDDDGGEMTDKSDTGEGGEPINAPPQPISVRPNNFAPINERRMINKKANAIKFLKTFIRNRNRTLDEVAGEVNITRGAARQYLSDYVGHVVSAVDSGQYPARVVMAYNEQSMPKHQRLTARDVQDMKPIILKYHQINIDSLAGNTDKGVDKMQNYRSPDPAIREFVDDMRGGGAMSPQPQQQQQPIRYDDETDEDDDEEDTPGGQFRDFNRFKQNRPQSSSRQLTKDSSIGDVLEFGIINSGQTDMAKIKRIKTMFLSNPPFYLSDESRFTDLLEANEIKPKVLATFMDWFKYIAPIKANERIGFLATAATQQGGTGAHYSPQQPPSSYQQGRGGGAAMMNQPFKKFDINEYDDYAQFLYTEGVYQYGLSPDHPINREGYRKYQEDKKYEEDQKKTMRQIDMMVKQNILRMGPGGQGGMNMMGMNGQPQGGPSTAFDERYLIDRGVLVPEITYTEDGKKITRLLPTGRPMYGGGGYMGGGGDNQEKDDFTDSISKFSRFLEAVRPMMQPAANNSGQPLQNPLVERMMEMAFNKMFSKVEETPSKVLENQMSLFQQFKQLFPGNDNQPLNETQARLQIELAKLNTDRDFHLQEVNFKQRQLEMEEKRHEDAKSESKDGLTWIMDALGKGFTAFQPIITSLLTGQGGGGLGSMIGGALGGGQPPMGPVMASPPGSMMGMDMMGGQSPFPPMNPQEGPEIMDNIPPPTQVPQDFMPQQQPQQQYDPYAQQPQYPPQYQQPQQQYPPQYSAAPPPQVEQYPQPPPDFLPENPPEPFAVPQPTRSENDFLNSLTPEDLATLSVDELAEVERRISTKQNKLEKVLNSIKSTKVRKQFGYRQPPQQQPDYSVLDVPKEMPSDYDGMPDYYYQQQQQPAQQQTEPVTGGGGGGETDENVPSSSEAEQRDFDVGATSVDTEDAQIAPLEMAEEMLNTTLDFESFNNGMEEITDNMGNDSQQFNQQNDANQKSYIDKIAALDKAEQLRVENEKRKTAGLAPLTALVEGNESEDAKKASDSVVHNRDDVIRTEEQAQRSKETKEQQQQQQQHKDKSHKGSSDKDSSHKKVDNSSGGNSDKDKTKTDESTTISNTKTVKTDLTKEKKQ